MTAYGLAVASYSASFNFNLEDAYVEWLSPLFSALLSPIVPWDKLFLHTPHKLSQCMAYA